jgi:proton-dependent oligopeptide transporter, POT family
MARRDWIHWITSAKKAKTHALPGSKMPARCSLQFAASLLLMAFAFLILPLGIKLAGAGGKSAFVWLFLSYVLQSIGELLIMPIGCAMIGKLTPRQYQGVMMGTWMVWTGLASLFAGDFSGMIPEPTGTTAIATNAGYAKLFAELGASSLVVGIVLVVLIPFLRKLITDKAEAPPAEVPTTVVQVAQARFARLSE